MVPVRLEITNFMSYQGHHELDFTGFKTASIVGTNGSGKSAILDAITWVLFGKSRITKDTERKDNVRERNDVINCYSTFCQVSLEFELEGKRYFVNRRIDRGKAGQGLQFKLLTDAGEVDLHGKGASDAEIEKELGVSFKVFLTSSFITQGDSSRFMEASPKERREILAEILELEVYEQCLEQAAEMAKEAKKTKENLEDKQKTLTELALLEPEIKRNLELAQTVLANSTAALEMVKIEKEKLTTDLVNLESQISSLQADEKKKKDLEDEEKKLEKDIAKWNEEILKAQAVIDKAEEIESGYRVLVQSKKELDLLNDKASKAHELEKKTFVFSKQIELEENNLKNALNQRMIEQSEALKASLSLPELDAQLKIAREDQTKLENVNSELAKLDLKLTSVIKDVANSKTNVDGINKKLAAKLSSLNLINAEAAKKELESLEQKTNQLHDEQISLETSEKNLNLMRIDIKLTKSEIDHLQDEIKLLELGETGNCPLCGQTLEKTRQDELLTQKTNAVKKYSDKLSFLLDETKSLADKIDNIKINIANINKSIERKPDLNTIIQLSSELDDVTRQFNDFDAIQKIVQKDKDQIQKQNESLLKNKADLEKSLLTANHNLEQAKKKTENMDFIAKEISLIEEKLKTRNYAKDEQDQLLLIKKEISELGFDNVLLLNAKDQCQKYQVYEERKKLLDKAKDYIENATPAIKQADDRIESVRKEIKNITERIAGLETFLTRKNTLDDDLKAVKLKEHNNSEERDTKLTQKNNLERDLTQSLNAKTELEEVMGKLLYIDNELKILEECKKMFGTDGIPSQILEGVIPELQEIANSILTDISQGRIGSEGMRLQIETSREGTTKTYKTLSISITDGQIRRPYELFSGGERFRADFAIRIALSQLLASRSGRRLRTLVIDEGFGTQDDEGIRRLIEAIIDISERFDKVLVISHVDELKNAFEKRVIVRRNSETSSFELV